MVNLGVAKCYSSKEMNILHLKLLATCETLGWPRL
jgi:hypothetical protein